MAKRAKKASAKTSAKGSKTASTSTEKPSASTKPNTVPLIGANALKALLRSDNRRKEQIDQLVGEQREEIGDAVQRRHLHKGAYALLKKFHRMTPEKAADLYDHLLAYLDMSGEMDRIESVAKLPLGEGEAESNDDDGDGGEPTNVEPFPRVAAE